jgi:hypothetical protein
MDKDKARLPDGRVFAIHNIKLEERYRHPDYDYTLGDGALSETGRIDLFELKSKKPNDPSFIARWDGGNRVFPHKIQYAVDIDIQGVSKAEQRRFRKGKGGYSGHHTTRASPDENRYEVLITTPSGVVFDATVSFNRHHGIAFTTKIDIVVTLRTVIMKAYQLARSSVRFCG